MTFSPINLNFSYVCATLIRIFVSTVSISFRRQECILIVLWLKECERPFYNLRMPFELPS